MIHFIFRYVIQKATVENNIIPTFTKLKEIGIYEPLSFLEETQIITYDYNNNKLFHCKQLFAT